MEQVTPGSFDDIKAPKDTAPEDLMARQRILEYPELFRILPQLSKKQLVRVIEQVTCGGFEIPNEEARDPLEKNALALAEHLATTRILLVVHATQRHIWGENVSAQSTEENKESINDQENQNSNIDPQDSSRSDAAN